MDNDLIFSELLIARFCHDISSQIGAVSNGLELLEEFGPEMAEKTLKLITLSSQESISRLSFYRTIYGPSNPNTMLDIASKRSEALEFFARSNVRLTWPIISIERSEHQCRLVFAMILLAKCVVVQEGEIQVDPQELSVTIIAKSYRGLEEVTAILRGEKQPLNVHNIHIHLAAKLARAVGQKLNISQQNDRTKIWAQLL